MVALFVVFAAYIQIGISAETVSDESGVNIGPEWDFFPKDCREIFGGCGGEEAPSGVYLIRPEGIKEPFDVYCENDIDGGKWTVIQRRKDGSIDFNRDWESYKNGFGFLHTEFWIGNEKLAYLTNQNKYELRIDVINSKGKAMYLQYDNFRINGEKGGYAVVKLGEFEGNTTADHMRNLEGSQFSTYDNDNDGIAPNCAQNSRGGWWFHQCNFEIYLNGIYGGADNVRKEIGFRIGKVRDSNLRFTEMKIRPLD